MATQLHKRLVKYWDQHNYVRSYWRDFDFTIFQNIQVKKRTTKNAKTYADVIIMADTETSRKDDGSEHNHICAWSIAFRTFHKNICTLWGQDPREFTEMLERLTDNIKADEIFIYWHNLAYDWVFTRKFMFEKFGFPKEQLNTKPLYPLFIRFRNGITFKDSLILAQRSLEKWANDLNVEHQKAVGKWDYEKVRAQHGETFSEDELLYIENDVLAGVECIDTTMQMIGKNISSIPYTATGIVRGEARDESFKNRGRDWFLRIQNEEYHVQHILELCFHGGYTHPNRYYHNVVTNAICKDFSSSYPFEILVRKYPGERFWKVKPEMATTKTILGNMEEYAFIFKVTCKNVTLFNKRDPMPTLLYSIVKMKSINAIVDNGRIMKADYISCYMNELDFELFIQHYDFDVDTLIISDCWCSKKDYLPRWFTDYAFERYRLKSSLKHIDPVLYGIEKSKLNALFGMCAQKACKPEVMEHYDRSEDVFTIEENFDPEAKYATWRNKRSSFLPYCIGVWITSYAMVDLFKLGACVSRDGAWLYSDTDSVYATAFDEDRLERFNQSRKELLLSRGYEVITIDGEDFTVGEATTDGVYTEFKALHSKCYCTRDTKGKLKITIAGVPKKGVNALTSIDDFQIGFRFSGEISGKLQHTHHFVDEIYTDDKGNLTGDSISLGKCDYIIKDTNYIPNTDLFETEVTVQSYEET